jgi:hypothetical protein
MVVSNGWGTIMRQTVAVQGQGWKQGSAYLVIGKPVSFSFTRLFLFYCCFNTAALLCDILFYCNLLLAVRYVGHSLVRNLRNSMKRSCL